MAESGLFIGWGDIRTGRDAAANKVFAEALAYWPTLQAAGEIESVETVILGLHGGDLAGFFLLRGDPERLGRLSMAPEARGGRSRSYRSRPPPGASASTRGPPRTPCSPRHRGPCGCRPSR